MSTIISAPLDFPKIEPDDWDKWWDVWNGYSKKIQKVNKSHNNLSSPWHGLDVYVRPGYEEGATRLYNFENINRPDLFSNFFNRTDEFPIHINIMRVASSFTQVVPHHDFTSPTYSIRSLLHDTNPIPTWYYLINNKKTYLNLPTNTNSWIYPDHESKHGSDYDYRYKKILIMFYGTIKENKIKMSIEQSKKKYPEYIIYKL
jgi:hypothetical protein